MSGDPEWTVPPASDGFGVLATIPGLSVFVPWIGGSFCGPVVDPSPPASWAGGGPRRGGVTLGPGTGHHPGRPVVGHEQAHIGAHVPPHYTR